jgi:hypothetical protein
MKLLLKMGQVKKWSFTLHLNQGTEQTSLFSLFKK